MIQQENTYFCTHNNNNIYIYGYVKKGTALNAGQPYLKLFQTEEKLIEFLTNKGIKYEKDEYL